MLKVLDTDRCFDINPDYELAIDIIGRGMKSFKERVYFNRSKEDNWDIEGKAEDLGFQNIDKLRYLGYEVGMKIEVYEDGTNKVLRINGKDVSNLSITI